MSLNVSPEASSQLERDITRFLSSGANPASFFAGLIANVPALVSAVSADGRIIFASPHHLALSGVADSLNDLETESDLFPSFVASRFPPSLTSAVLEQNLRNWELSIQHKNGRVFVYDMQHRIIENALTGEKVVLTIGVDVSGATEGHDTALQEHKRQLNYLSFHDPLTGLANRSLFYDRVHKSLSLARRSNSNLAILLVDLDRFKNINDSLGRDAGDFYLKQAAIRLSETLRDTDTVARLSGDEFVVVLENIAQAKNITAIAAKILTAIAQPLDVTGHEITCTASIGISLYPKDGNSIDQLLKHADLAMSRAKALGKNRTQFYVQAMTDNAVNYLLLENDLRKAIENDELCLHYQPQLDLASGTITGLEALVRWQHSERGLIPPSEFIPLAEETGLIEPLGNWVLKEACQSFSRWLMSGLNFGKVAVNLSPRQFRQEHFEQVIVKTLLETQLSPEYLELEITESSAMENAAEAIELLKGFSEMGLSLAIDDFGTGYSSLAYLKRFPINKLKIDRSFIKDIDHDEADAAIAKSIIDLSHNMSLIVVAEGVERQSQSRWLNEKGCDQVQGYFFAKPLAEAELLSLVGDKSKAECSQKEIRLTNYHS